VCVITFVADAPMKALAGGRLQRYSGGGLEQMKLR
jgi:hypothetical protein